MSLRYVRALSSDDDLSKLRIPAVYEINGTLYNVTDLTGITNSSTLTDLTNIAGNTNTTLSGASFKTLSDVDWSTPPTNGQVFKYDSSTSKMIPFTLPAAGIAANDYATPYTGGTIKIGVSNGVLYISNDGSDAEEVISEGGPA